jgi:hypothetical protein
VEADIVAGNARLGAKQDEEVWEGKVSSWNKKVEELDSMRVIPPKVDIEKREYTVYRWYPGRAVETANDNAVGAELG